MYCEKCGVESEEEFNYCFNCGEALRKEAVDAKSDIKKININAWRKLMLKGSTKVNYNTEVQVNRENVIIKSTVNQKENLYSFNKDEIRKIKYKKRLQFVPVDIFFMLASLILLVAIGIFGILPAIFFMHYMILPTLSIVLKDGTKIHIPTNQRADILEALEAVDYGEAFIEKVRKKSLKEGDFKTKRLISFLVLLVLATVSSQIGFS